MGPVVTWSQYSDDFVSVGGHDVKVGARIWFDPDDPVAQEVLRPEIREFAKALAREHELRHRQVDLRDPDGLPDHDYINRGGILQITLFRSGV